MDTLFDPLVESIVAQIKPICEQLETLPVPERIEALNKIRLALHEVSPFKDPVDCVLWVPGDNVTPNDYNPNNVSPPKMKSLKWSIAKDHYTQPVVTCPVDEDKNYVSPGDDPDRYVVVDGEHRYKVVTEDRGIKKRLMGYLPVTTILQSRSGRTNLMGATYRHNDARGVHGVVPMTDIITNLIRLGWTDDEVAKELGMDADEVLRFKHVAGLADLFKDREYSKAWE